MEVTPRPSATVMLVRDAADGLEVFMVRRHARSHMAADAWVFPGGAVDPDDAPLAPPGAAGDLRARTLEPIETEAARGLYVCAARELFEEAGVLLSRPTPTAEVGAQRAALLRGETVFADVLARLRVRLALDALIPFSHWVTPAAAPTRADAWFFVAAMPSGQQASHCGVETTDGAWLRPEHVLARHPIIFPTQAHLRRLADLADADALVAFARTKPIPRVLPLLRTREDGAREISLPPELVDRW